MSRSARAGATPRRGLLGRAARLWALAAMMAVAALLAAGCGGSSNSGGSNSTNASTATTSGSSKPITIGLMVPTFDIQFYVDQVKDLKQKVAAIGGKVVVGVYDNNPVKEVQIAQDWINGGQVDAITGGITPTGFQPALDLAAQKHVAVVMLGVAPPDKPLQAAQTELTGDPKQWGVTGGQAMARCVNERLGGRAEVAILGGPDNFGPVVTERIVGIKQGLAQGAPGAKIVVEQNGDNSQLKSFQVMETILQAHPNINVVAAVGDDGVLGGMKALVNAGRDPRKLCLVGMDSSDAGYAALHAGKFYAEINIGLGKTYDETLKAIQAMVKDPNDPHYAKRVVTLRFETVDYQ